MKRNLTLFLATMLVSIFTIQAQNALNFDGINEYADCGTFNLSDNNITFETWIKVDNFQAASPYISSIMGQEGNKNTALLRLGDGSLDSNKVQFVLYIKNNYKTDNGEYYKLNANTGLEHNKWYHIAATYNGSDMKLYINGNLDGTLSPSYDVIVSNGNFQLAAVNNDRFLDGMLDETRVWNIAKSEIEIKANMYNEIDPASANLVAYYNFNEISGSALPDLINTHNATLYNMEDEDWTESYAMVVPQNLISDGYNLLSWEAPLTGGFDSYYLEIAEDINFTTYVTGYNPYKDMGIATSENCLNLTNGNTYYAKVRAFKTSTGDVGASSDILTFTAVNEFLSGIYNIGQGAGDDYPTLYDALQDIKTNGVDAPVTFQLSADYNPVSETNFLLIEAFTGASETNTLTIKPAPGTSHIIEKNAPFIIGIEDASHIIIDGSNNETDSRDLTLSYISALSQASAIFIHTDVTPGENITIKNCIIKGGTKEFECSGIANDYFTNVTIENNKISRARIGVISFGSNVTIKDNEIGSENSDEYLHFGTSVQFGSEITISGNKIYNLIDNQDFDAIRAIAVNDLTGDIIISNNFIDNLIHTGNNVVQAIGISDCTPSDMRIFNNRISNIASNSFENNYPGGIVINCPAMTGGMYIMHNSINIPENTTYGIGGTNNTLCGGINIGAGTGISFVNNIISNTLGERTGATFVTFAAAILVNSDVSPFMLNDENLFYAAGNNDFSFMAMNTTGGLSLSEWKTWTGGGVFSIFDEALFSSDDDLNLQACSPAIAHAEYRSYYEFDIENNARDTQYPTMGAYEYLKLQATNLVIALPVKGMGFLHWTQGNGCKAVVFMKQGHVLPEIPAPINGTTYLPNLDFGSGDQIGTSGWFCVFNGFGNGNFSVNGSNGEYTAMVCEYFGDEGNEIYLTEIATQNPYEGHLASGIEDINSKLINIHPNPTTGKVTIDFSKVQNTEKIQNITVTDISGKIVYINQFKISDNKLQVDLSSFEKGIYIISIQTNKEIFTSKIVKE